jgi:hypothetical protein
LRIVETRSMWWTTRRLRRLWIETAESGRWRSGRELLRVTISTQSRLSTHADKPGC